jgi:Mg2+/Co2+ transporter CorB
MGLLVFWALLAVASVSLCSVLETTPFSVRLSALIERKAAGSSGAARLLEIKSNRIEDAIGAILTVNTVMQTLGTTLAGAQAAKLFGSLQVGLISAGLVVCLLIISEIVPKTLAARYAGALSGFTGHVLWHLIPVVRPIIFLTGALIRLLARRPRERFTRREFAMLVGSAPRDGALSLAEASVIGNLIYSREVTLSDVMIPLSMVFMLDAVDTVANLLASPVSDAFNQILLYRRARSRFSATLPTETF